MKVMVKAMLVAITLITQYVLYSPRTPSVNSGASKTYFPNNEQDSIRQARNDWSMHIVIPQLVKYTGHLGLPASDSMV